MSVENTSQYMRPQGKGILCYQSSNSYVDAGGCLTVFHLQAQYCNLAKNTGSFLHLLAALFKGGILLAKVGHLETCKEYTTDHPPVSVLLINLVAEMKNRGISLGQAFYN